METDKPVEKPVEKMEVDDSEAAEASTSGAPRKQQQQILAKNAIPSVAISLHPLVLMNIAEHWTRFRAQDGVAHAVYGALIGKQDGRKIEVYNSFELRHETIIDDVVINRDYYNTKEEQCKIETHRHLLPWIYFTRSFRQASLQRLRFLGMVHVVNTANRAAYQDPPADLPNQRKPNSPHARHFKQTGRAASNSALRVGDRHCRWRSYDALRSSYVHVGNRRS